MARPRLDVSPGPRRWAGEGTEQCARAPEQRVLTGPGPTRPSLGRAGRLLRASAGSLGMLTWVVSPGRRLPAANETTGRARSATFTLTVNRRYSMKLRRSVPLAGLHAVGSVWLGSRSAEVLSRSRSTSLGRAASGPMMTWLQAGPGTDAAYLAPAGGLASWNWSAGTTCKPRPAAGEHSRLVTGGSNCLLAAVGSKVLRSSLLAHRPRGQRGPHLRRGRAVHAEGNRTIVWIVLAAYGGAPVGPIGRQGEGRERVERADGPGEGEDPGVHQALVKLVQVEQLRLLRVPACSR